MFSELFKKNKIAVKEQPTMINESYEYPSLMKKDEQFEKDLNALRLKYKMGQIPKINAAERQILEFCHNRDMIEFLREEFEKHPIRLDDDGGLIGENPFKKEREEQKHLIVDNTPKADYEIL